MPYYKKLGIFVRVPVAGEVKTRLVPPLSPQEACDLYHAFINDLFLRVTRLKKVAGTVFYAGGNPAMIEDFVPDRFTLVPQEGDTLGERLLNAFRVLLQDEGSWAAIIGSDSPDVPLTYVKRAYLKLKHRDIVLGPAFDGGYYLIAMKSIIPSLFRDIAWGGPTVLAETLGKIQTDGLECALLPLWYDVDDTHSLALLESVLLAKRLQKIDRLQHTERVLSAIRKRQTGK
ncbi:MAG: TIGR04282 family arsenosugar biosynthesis glycosyltransferase [Candidatus Latescibacterota bacterium]|nr:MAG: TIGR04282 family arsenosugar biosynthesis glycosyltransferase [Candidatus Latescibacterota bacterium]